VIPREEEHILWFRSLIAAARELAGVIDQQADGWTDGDYVDFAAVVDACRPLRKALGLKSKSWGDDE
jgi:hypothetical protein